MSIFSYIWEYISYTLCLLYCETSGQIYFKNKQNLSAIIESWVRTLENSPLHKRNNWKCKKYQNKYFWNSGNQLRAFGNSGWIYARKTGWVSVRTVSFVPSKLTLIVSLFVMLAIIYNKYPDPFIQWVLWNGDILMPSCLLAY